MAIHPTSWTSDLDTRYELLEEAGRGGMGVVYKARDRETGEIVALKILKRDIALDPVAAERFINEVRLSRRITHKNVTRVYEFTRAGATAYLSMEYVEGESLRSIVDRMGAVGLRKGVQIGRQICAALHEAHSQGIVHRDLKPENVMLDKSGSVKVMDFGIARLLDASVTATAGGIIGTPAYMAPEQAEGKPVDARTDIYAVGLILYEVFTGRTAFTGDTPMVVALKQIRETPVSPRTLEPTIPWELEATILRCMDKDPAQRFQSAEEVDAALAAVSSGASPTGSIPVDPNARATGVPTWPTVSPAQTTPIAQRGTKRSERRSGSRRILFVAAAALALAVVFGVFRQEDRVPFEAFTLDNGLRVILSEDHSAPTIAVAVTYNVGAKDDPPGRSGLAHLFEHMLFNGSLNVGNGEHHYLVASQGGVPNGITLMDFTRVWETLPSNQLDLALFLEADRMRSLRLDQARLDNERNTVLAERQQRVDNQPYGRVLDVLYETAYDIAPYKKNYTGSEEGLRAITLQEVNDFFRIFYAPNNAVLTLVGDFNSREARTKIENYFQHIPAQPPAPDIDLSENEQSAERRRQIEDPFATAPRTYLAYKMDAGTSKDAEAAAVLVSLLSGGTASRLHQRLIKELEIIDGLAGSIDPRKGRGLMALVLLPSAGRDEASVLKAYDDVIARIRDDGVSNAEVARVRTRLLLARATTMQQTAERAALLGEFETKFGDANLINQRDQWLREVKADDVRRVAQRYLDPSRRTIVSVVRGGTTTPTFKAITTPSASQPLKAERLNRAPVSKDLIRVSLPGTRETTLRNGLTVLSGSDSRVPLVVARFEIGGAGPVYAPADNPGIALLAAAMLSKGTPSKSSLEIAEQFDALGVSVAIAPSTDPGSIVVLATGLSETFGDWFPAVTDVVRNASFPADELTSIKRRIVADWQSRRSLSSLHASDLFDEAIYGAAGRASISEATVAGITSEHLRAWHRERYAPQNIVLSVMGDVDVDDVGEAVEERLGDWARGNVAPTRPAFLPPERARVVIVDRAGSVQTSLVLGVPAVERAHLDQLPLVVANRVLGGTPVARLFTSLRGERGLTFSASSQLHAHAHGGDWRATGDITSARIDEGIEAFLAELRRIASEPVPAQELDDAKRSMVASFALTLEQLAQVVSYISSRRVYGLSTDHWQRYPEKVMAVSAEDVQRVARQYMDLARLQVVAVGDVTQLEPLLSPLGATTVVR